MPRQRWHRKDEKTLRQFADTGRATTKRRNPVLEDHEWQHWQRHAGLQQAAGTGALADCDVSAGVKDR